ncbi:MAG TPA: penicillin acylase family protein [Longimicrobiaceae bacterium]|jgi:penicillin amidase
MKFSLNLCTIAVFAAPAFCLASAAAAQSDTLRVPGVAAPVEIVRDRWGVPHIYAQSTRDLFFAQGYNAARDRLFQLEMWRRQATGTLAEVLGPRELKRDTGARLFAFRGDMRAELRHYHPQGEEIVGAFVDGVNARIAETERDPRLLPPEFGWLGIRPGHWTPEIVVSRHNGLYRNLGQEVALAQALRHTDAATIADVNVFAPGEPRLELDPAIDASRISNGILELYDAFRAPLAFRPEDVVPAARADRTALARLSAAAPARPDWSEEVATVGSNNWVVAGSRTASGKPLLANDPHRALQVPSLRYWVHLTAPGWDVIGGGEPALPGVSIGHNAEGAWGLTVFGLDHEDLYVYETDPADPHRYRYRGGWETMRVLRDTVRVKGGAPVVVELKYTRHGPVLHEDREGRRAYALRAAWLEPGTAPYLASLRMNQARTWEEFLAACEFSLTPAENMVWADRRGNIGWQAAGIAPVRRTWSGLLPVPGDGRYEWDGFLPVRQLPGAANPRAGFLATANENNVPAGYPHNDAVTLTWADPYRVQRIAEVLGARRGLTVRDMAALQQDETSLPARALVPLLRRVQTEDWTARRARELLLGWDHVLGAESVPAAIYVAWERRLQRNLRDRIVPEPARPFLPGAALERTVELMTRPDERLGGDPARIRDAILARSLEEAVAELKERLGPDMAAWRYGQTRMHHVQLRHPLSAALDSAGRAGLDHGPLPRGGSAQTVNASAPDAQTHGASFRIVADPADWDASLGTNSPGQSGDPRSPHYGDLFGPWARGEYFPVLYSRDRVQAAAETTTVLLPGR